MAPFPPRIHVLLARKSPVGLVIRRGPSKSVATVLWNRDTDQFQVGQWLRGRIYERRSDLSPDGRYLLYFAMNGKWHADALGAWTAISKAPYLKARALFPKGDCWHGGGLWTGLRTYWLNDAAGHKELTNTLEVLRDKRWQPSTYYGGECPGVYYPRLIRDGWKLTKSIEDGRRNDRFLFEKPYRNGWILQKTAHSECGAQPGKGCYWDSHALINRLSGESIAAPKWEWADLDNERIVWAVDGRIETGSLDERGLFDQRTLIDLSNMRFENIEAPY